MKAVEAVALLAVVSAISVAVPIEIAPTAGAPNFQATSVSQTLGSSTQNNTTNKTVEVKNTTPIVPVDLKTTNKTAQTKNVTVADNTTAVPGNGTVQIFNATSDSDKVITKNATNSSTVISPALPADTVISLSVAPVNSVKIELPPPSVNVTEAPTEKTTKYVSNITDTNLSMANEFLKLLNVSIVDTSTETLKILNTAPVSQITPLPTNNTPIINTFLEPFNFTNINITDNNAEKDANTSIASSILELQELVDSFILNTSVQPLKTTDTPTTTITTDNPLKAANVNNETTKLERIPAPTTMHIRRQKVLTTNTPLMPVEMVIAPMAQISVDVGTVTNPSSMPVQVNVLPAETEELTFTQKPYYIPQPKITSPEISQAENVKILDMAHIPPNTETFVIPADSVKVIGEPIAQRPINIAPDNSDMREQLAAANLSHDIEELIIPGYPPLADFKPLIISSDVMRHVAGMRGHRRGRVDIQEAHPFAFNNAEPLDTVEAVKVMENPINELDAQMDPVVVVQSPISDQASPIEIIPVRIMENPVESVQLQGFIPDTYDSLRGTLSSLLGRNNNFIPEGYRSYDEPRLSPFLIDLTKFPKEIMRRQFNHMKMPLDPQFRPYPFRIYHAFHGKNSPLRR